MNLVWSPEAERDLGAIFDYILVHDPDAAERMYDRIEQRVRDLADYPHLGRPGRPTGTREIIVPGTPYIVVYRVGRSRIDILAVLHGARRA